MYSTESIVLRKIDAGETDALFVIYTEKFGKLRALAQGIKKEEAKLKGHLEKMNLAEISFVSGKNGYRLTAARMTNHFSNIRASFNFTKLAHYFSALYDALIFEGDRDEELWELLKKTFLFLDSRRDFPEKECEAFLSLFEKKLVSLLGYGGQDAPSTDFVSLTAGTGFGAKIPRPEFGGRS